MPPAQKARSARRPTLSAGEKDLLRYAAETAYVLTPGEMTVAELCQQAPFNGVTRAAVQKWADEGNWVARRQEHLSDLRDRINVRIGQTLIEDRVQQIADQQRICDQGLDMLEDDALQPKSFEGVAQMVVGTFRSMDQTRQSLAADIQSGLGRASVTPPTEFREPIEASEAHAAARALVRARQQRLRNQPVIQAEV
jgi:hypothetical protein